MRCGGSMLAVTLLSVAATAIAESPNRRTGGPTNKKRPPGGDAAPQFFPEKVQWEDAKGGMHEEIVQKEWVSPQQERAMDPNKVVAANQNEIARRVEAAGKALDRAEQHAAEWGHASIASAVLVKSVGDDGLTSPFSIRSGNDDSTYNYGYFEGKVRNSVQGAAARYAEKFMGARAEVKAGTDLNLQREGQIQEIQQQTRLLEALKLRKQAEAALHPKPETKEDPDAKVLKNESAVADEEETETEEEEEEEEPDANAAMDTLLPGLDSATAGDDGTIQNLFTPSEFADYQALLTGKMKTASPAAQAAQANGQQAAGEAEQPAAGAETPDLATLAVVADQLTLSEGDVMKSASSNLVMKKVLNYLTAPVDAGSNNVAWFMVTQVSVSPGSRTARDYVAETTLHPYYAKLNGEKVEGQFDPNVVHPGIFAAFPLVEAQALDLRNSERFETRLSFALAAQLIAQGKKAEAKFFLERITKIQQDIATRTQLPLVVPSSNGREVTYRFDPALQGLMEPGNRKSGSGMVLNANSIPALIVIMTDRKSLDEYTHLEFELHTRWIPKKQSSIWSTAWDGVVRNYNPRDPMNPSEVIGAAASLDEARSHLDWADRYKIDRLYGTTMATGLRAALEQARWRHSALSSKIGSSNSNIALPIHFQVKPKVFQPIANEDQHVLIERFSGKPHDFNLGKMDRMSLGSVELLRRNAYDLRTEKLRSEIVEKERSKKFLATRLEQDLREAVALLESHASNLRNAQTEKLEVKNPRVGGVVGKGGKLSRWVTGFFGEKPPPPPEAQTAIAAQQELVLKDLEAQLKEYGPLADTLAESPESFPAVIGKVRSLPKLSLLLQRAREALGGGEPAAKAGYAAIDLAGDFLLGPEELVAQLKDYLMNQERLASLASQRGQLGYFEPNADWSYLITLPSDRSRNLPQGVLPVIGHVMKNGSPCQSFKFGELEVKTQDTVVVTAVKGSELPLQVQGGHRITVVGANLDQVRCAFWASSRKKFQILSKSRGLLDLGANTIPPNEKFVILTNSLEPPGGPVESVTLAHFDVSYQKEEVKLETDSVTVRATKPSAVLKGFFPEGTAVSLVTAAGKLPVEAEIKGSRDEATLKLDPVLFPDSPPEKDRELKIEVKYEKSVATIPLVLKEDRITVSAVYPGSSTKSALDGPLKSMRIGVKLHESLGNTAEVFIGGSYIGTGKLEGSMLVVEKMKDGLAGLQPGKFDLVLLCKGEDFKWPEMFTVLPEAEKPAAAAK